MVLISDNVNTVQVTAWSDDSQLHNGKQNEKSQQHCFKNCATQTSQNNSSKQLISANKCKISNR